MTREQEVMNFLHQKVFGPILASKDAPANIKSGVHLTIARMSKLSAEKMVQYFWSALATDNGIAFADRIKLEGLPRFEDVSGEFAERFDDAWLKGGK